MDALPWGTPGKGKAPEPSPNGLRPRRLDARSPPFCVGAILVGQNLEAIPVGNADDVRAIIMGRGFLRLVEVGVDEARDEHPLGLAAGYRGSSDETTDDGGPDERER